MAEGKTFVIGDIHGGYRALVECLEKSGFDRQADTLICLGDICDGWPDTDKCVEVLLGLDHLVYILGNHDWWLLSWAKSGFVDPFWAKQGGQSTLDAYPQGLPKAHADMLATAKLYHLTDDNRIFVHGGFLLDRDIAVQDEDILLWDRSLFRKAHEMCLIDSPENITPYKETYIGHTPTHQFGFRKPVKCAGVWFMDTGAGWTGPLSMMDINSKEQFISTPVFELYPESIGRARR